MIRQHEQRKFVLEQLPFKPRLDTLQPVISLGLSEASLRNELKALQKANEKLGEDAASLQSRNEELKAYAHTVAHALKNPLAIMTVTSSAITEIGDLTLEEQRDFFQQIKTSAYEMNDIIDSLLFLSEVNMLDRPVETLDMASILVDVLKRLNHMVKEYHGRIILPETWPEALGYAPWIEEVWTNYISNALKYGGQAPHVELGASLQPDGMVRFWTRDYGTGIPKEIQARLFTPFTRFDQDHRPGYGLGLSIVRRIIERSGGQAGVESDAGKGSLFYFTLPASPENMDFMPGGMALASQVSGR
jgi:two-component system, sensor histidine kinase and response regulator